MSGELAIPTIEGLNNFNPINIEGVDYYRAVYMVEVGTEEGDITPIGLATANGGIPVYIAQENSDSSILGLYTIDSSNNVTPVLDTNNYHVTIKFLV